MKNHTQSEKLILNALNHAHEGLSDKELDKVAIKQGFKNWRKLVQMAAKMCLQLKLNLSQAIAKEFDVEYKPINWLGMLLSLCVTTPIKQAAQQLVYKHQQVRVDNFAIECRAAYKSVIEYWSDIEINSVVNNSKALFGKENLLYLTAIVVALSLDKSRTTANETLFGEWSFDFYDKDYTSNSMFLELERRLVAMFSEEVSFDKLLLFKNSSLDWRNDNAMVAFYCWFNKYTTYLHKPIEFRQKMVFTATFFFVSLLDNKFETVYPVREITETWQGEMIDGLIWQWFVA